MREHITGFSGFQALAKTNQSLHPRPSPCA
jgi:hypothetical protein